MAPLDTPAEVLDVFAPVAVEVSRYPATNQPSALPWLGETQFFALRPQWLEGSSQIPPETWDAAVDSAIAVNSQLDPDQDLAAFAIRSLDGHELVESFLPILRGFGKSLVDPESNVPQLDTPEALAAVETFLTLAGFSPVESPAVDAPNNAERFEAGEISMMANFWASDLLASRSIESLPESGPIATTLQPAQPGVDRLAMTGIWLAGNPAGSLQPEAARNFLDWIVSLELQSQLPGLGLPPVRVDVLSDPPLTNRFPDLPVLKEMLFVASPRPRSPFYPQLERLLATELQQAVDGTVSGADALKNANIALREFLVREGVLAG
jgi:multiple sugar transport system substrate-binding protein